MFYYAYFRPVFLWKYPVKACNTADIPVANNNPADKPTRKTKSSPKSIGTWYQIIVTTKQNALKYRHKRTGDQTVIFLFLSLKIIYNTHSTNGIINAVLKPGVGNKFFKKNIKFIKISTSVCLSVIFVNSLRMIFTIPRYNLI